MSNSVPITSLEIRCKRELDGQCDFNVPVLASMFPLSEHDLDILIKLTQGEVCTKDEEERLSELFGGKVHFCQEHGLEHIDCVFSIPQEEFPGIVDNLPE